MHALFNSSFRSLQTNVWEQPYPLKSALPGMMKQVAEFIIVYKFFIVKREQLKKDNADTIRDVVCWLLDDG